MSDFLAADCGSPQRLHRRWTPSRGRALPEDRAILVHTGAEILQSRLVCSPSHPSLASKIAHIPPENMRDRRQVTWKVIGDFIRFANRVSPQDALVAFDAATLAMERNLAETAAHQRRVASLATEIAFLVGLSPKEISDLNFAASLHDFGKLGVSPGLLSRPRGLSFCEKIKVRTHLEIGYFILEAIADYSSASEILLYNHVFDGYPKWLVEQLKGNPMPLAAQILSMADCFDALGDGSRRYLQGNGLVLSPSQTLREIRKRNYDSRLIDALAEITSCLEEGIELQTITPHNLLAFLQDRD